MIWKGLVYTLILTRLACAATNWPPELQMRVPFEPTAFPSDGRTYVAYELYLTNFSSKPITLERVEVVDADDLSASPVAVLEAAQLDTLVKPIGIEGSTGGDSDGRQLASGRSIVVFLWIARERGERMPSHLRQRVTTAEFVAEGATISTHHSKLLVLGPPVTGPNWLADDGPSNDRDNHHRRGILIVHGAALISRRYAIDWEQRKDGENVFGDASDNRSYYAYGKPVLAVADSTVATATDGLPDNVPGHDEKFHPAVEITPDTVFGNHIVLDLGGQLFAAYLHLQPGSVRVKRGDHVRRGQLLANIGDSGDAREPHVHFQVQTSPDPLDGEGVPYLIDHYLVRSGNGLWQTRNRELPLGGMLIDFSRANPPSKAKRTAQ